MMYRLEVAPGIFADGTYTVYAVPDDDAEVRYQVRGRFLEIDDAVAYASRVIAVALESFHAEVQVSRSLEGKLRPAPKQSAEALAVRLHELAETERLAAWSRQLDGLPILFAMTLLGYLAWTAIFGGDVELRRSVAYFSPVVLGLLAVSNRVRAQLRSRRYTRECALVVKLALHHGWRREDFFPLLVALEHPGKRALPLLLYSGWLYDVVPRWFEQAGLEFMYLRPREEWGPKHPHELAEWLRDEDYEARIQTLAMLQEDDEPIRFSALRCLATSRRAVRRARALVTEGVSAVAYLDTVALPGFDDYLLAARFGPVAALVSPTIHTAALGWCFLISPWSGLYGVGMMAATLFLCTVPIILWNWAQLVQKRGLPKGFSLVDLQGPMRLNRGI